MVGARGPQLVKRAAAWALERHKDCLAACQQLIAARAPHIKILLFHNASKSVVPLKKSSYNAASRKGYRHRRNLRTELFLPCGAVG